MRRGKENLNSASLCSYTLLRLGSVISKGLFGKNGRSGNRSVVKWFDLGKRLSRTVNHFYKATIHLPLVGNGTVAMLCQTAFPFTLF